MDSELEKIKGLEEAIQTYVERHSNSKLSVEYSRDIQFDGQDTTSEWFCWKIVVKHDATPA